MVTLTDSRVMTTELTHKQISPQITWFPAYLIQLLPHMISRGLVDDNPHLPGIKRAITQFFAFAAELGNPYNDAPAMYINHKLGLSD